MARKRRFCCSSVLLLITLPLLLLPLLLLLFSSSSSSSSSSGEEDGRVASLTREILRLEKEVEETLSRIPPPSSSSDSSSSSSGSNSTQVSSAPPPEAQRRNPISKEANKLHAVTYASHGGRDDRFCRAIESALRHEIDLVILGWGVKWRGLSQKLEAARSYAQSLPPDDVMLFTDAFDVMFTNTPLHIMNMYYELSSPGADIIFAGECGCWPHVTIDHGRPCFEKYPKAPTPYRYLNSGTWIGKARSSAVMLEAVEKEAGKNFAKANDQELVANMFMEGRYGIVLDYYAKLFQSMHLTLDKPLPRCYPYKDIEVVGGRIHNKRTDSYPAVLHFNGGGKRHHLEIEGKLWYKQSKFNSADEVDHMKSHLLSAPTASNPHRKITFGDICPNYFPGTAASQPKKDKLNMQRSRNVLRQRSYI